MLIQKILQPRTIFNIKSKCQRMPEAFVIYVPIWTIIRPEMFCNIISLVNQLDLYSIQEVSINLLIGSFFALGSFDETILVVCGRELVAFANQGIETLIRIKFRKSLSTKTKFIRSFWNENLKVYFGKKFTGMHLLQAIS